MCRSMRSKPKSVGCVPSEVAAEVEKLTSVTSEEYNESEEGIGYLAKKYHFPNGKVVMPAEAMEDITDLLN